MPPDHPALTPAEVIAGGGWHPRYARVLATASDGDYGFALVDGNGDGAELEAEAWMWDHGNWAGAGSSGAGPLGSLGPVRTGGHIGNACFAYGSAPRPPVDHHRLRRPPPPSPRQPLRSLGLRQDPHRPSRPRIPLPSHLTRTWGHPPLMSSSNWTFSCVPLTLGRAVRGLLCRGMTT